MKDPILSKKQIEELLTAYLGSDMAPIDSLYLTLKKYPRDEQVRILVEFIGYSASLGYITKTSWGLSGYRYFSSRKQPIPGYVSDIQKVLALYAVKDNDGKQVYSRRDRAEKILEIILENSPARAQELGEAKERYAASSQQVIDMVNLYNNTLLVLPLSPQVTNLLSQLNAINSRVSADVTSLEDLIAGAEELAHLAKTLCDMGLKINELVSALIVPPSATPEEQPINVVTPLVEDVILRDRTASQAMSNEMPINLDSEQQLPLEPPKKSGKSRWISFPKKLKPSSLFAALKRKFKKTANSGGDKKAPVAEPLPSLREVPVTENQTVMHQPTTIEVEIDRVIASAVRLEEIQNISDMQQAAETDIEINNAQESIDTPIETVDRHAMQGLAETHIDTAEISAEEPTSEQKEFILSTFLHKFISMGKMLLSGLGMLFESINKLVGYGSSDSSQDLLSKNKEFIPSNGKQESYKTAATPVSESKGKTAKVTPNKTKS